MDQSLRKGVLAGAACACLVGLAGCASPQPRDFTGAWHPVNRFAAAPERVELRPPYAFRATPLDATLKGVLGRWASDAGLGFDYRLSYDLALHQPVAAVQSERIVDAIAQLDALFASQQVAITLTRDQIVVAPRAEAAVAGIPQELPGVGSPIRPEETDPAVE